jgi:N-ethylmaleimide reductase
MTTEAFWQPISVGALDLPHRLALAPMTRSRARADGTPTELNATYYAQRASTALVITEGTQPSADGQGYISTPGIYTDAHIDGWRTVTEAVHAAGGRIVIQLMHTGRIAHPDNTPHGRQPVAPSAIAPKGEIFTVDGMKAMPRPRALATAEVVETIRDFRRAAAAAIAAGADGVEIHGANGYLVHQFLSSNANRRDDRYGGSIANRIRFAVEVAEAVADEIGPERTGIQISPGNAFNDMVEDDTAALYAALLEALAPIGLAYVNVAHQGDEELLAALRRDWPGTLLLNRGGADLDARAQDLADGIADVVTVGRPALANPDLVERIKAGGPHNEPDPSTFYGGGEHGYTDYPSMQAA